MNRVEQLLSLARRGVLRRADLIGDLIDLANELPAADIIQAIPSEVRSELAAAVEHAPKSDSEWNSTTFIVGGSYRCSSRQAADAAKDSYRNGVELLRAFFQSGFKSA